MSLEAPPAVSKAGDTMVGRLVVPTITVTSGGTFSGTFSGGTYSTGGTFTGKRFIGAAPVSFTTAAASAVFYYSGNVSGSITESSTMYSGLVIANDTATTTGSANVFETVLNVRAGATGTRNGIMSKMNVLGTPGDTGQWYVAVEGDSFASANAGGTSTSSPSGAVRGAEFSALLGTGATFYQNVGALELSAGIQTGASSNYRTIISIEAAGDETTRGANFDAGITFNHGSATTPGLGYGIAFGHPGAKWYFASDSVLIGAVPRSDGVGGTNSVPLLADRGVDLSKVWFTTASMVLPGAWFDPTGDLNIANATVARTSAGVSIDIPRLSVTAASISATGVAYTVNDLVYENTSGSVMRVSAVDGSGHITGLTLLVPGSLTSAPGGPLAVTGGNGNSAAVTLTTASRNELSLNPSGGPIKAPLLTNAANDAAAASAGVAVGQFYRNGSVVMQRVS